VVYVAVAQVFLTTSYVSPYSYQSKDSEIVHYKATFCPNSKVRDRLANLKVTLQDQPWVQENGVYVLVAVYNSTADNAQPLCTNVQNGVITEYCAFTYIAGMGTLYVRAQSGPTGNIAYTLDMSFSTGKVTSNRKIPRKVEFHPKQNRYLHGNLVDYIELQQIAKLDTPATVPNTPGLTQYITFNFEFCPVTANYNVSVAVMATDLQSDFESYLCAQPPCRAPTSLVRATCDCPVNFMKLIGSGTIYTDLYVTVRGRGEVPLPPNIGISSFLLSVTLDQPQV